MHLRMTGNLVLVDGAPTLDPSEGMRLYEGERSADERYLRARFVLDDGRELWFTDPRRFGEAFLIDDSGLDARFERLGVEPLSEEFTPEALGRARRRAHGAAEVVPARPVAGRRGRQHLRRRGALPGRLHPLSPAGSMRPEHHEALHAGIVAALEAGIDGGGASIDDFRDGRGERGYDAGRVPRPHPRGRGVPALRRDDRQDRRRRPLDLLLPRLPGPAPPPPAPLPASGPSFNVDRSWPERR